jgi:hypothetical protein
MRFAGIFIVVVVDLDGNVGQSIAGRQYLGFIPSAINEIVGQVRSDCRYLAVRLLFLYIKAPCIAK